MSTPEPAYFEASDGYRTLLKARTEFRHSAGGRRILQMIEEHAAASHANMARIPELHDWIRSIDFDRSNDTAAHWKNHHLPVYDAVAIALMLLIERPKIYLEIGSGNSTKFAHSAIQRFGLPTRIISIDPNPRAEIDALCETIIRKPLEEAVEGVLPLLTRDAVVYFDGSHRLLPNSDVLVFFTEILPAIPDGVIYGIHDILLPNDYTQEFVARLYSEQYVLTAYLLGGADGDLIELPLRHLTLTEDFAKHMPVIDHPASFHGESFWLRRRAARC